MKSLPFFWLTMLVLSLHTGVFSQDYLKETDSSSVFRPVPVELLPKELFTSLDTVKLLNCSALFIFNHSLHPLGKLEFMDSNQCYRKLNIPIKMNRCTLIYIESGLHKLHTIYQTEGKAVVFKPGLIYFAELFTRTRLFIPGGIPNKNKAGDEFGAVIFSYTTLEKGKALLLEMKKNTVLKNE